MKRFLGLVICLAFILAAPGLAVSDEATDITKETIVGPGSIGITAKGDIMMSFGATVRIIPTAESNWDFGLTDKVDGYLYLPVNPADLTKGFKYNLGDNFLKDHANESGWVNNEYIRTETKLHFNAMPKNRVWSFYAALEYDRPLDTSTVDSRGGINNDDSNFGLERLHITYQMPFDMRLHAGWDIWHLDAFAGGGLIYGDDNPGFWLTGDYDTWEFNVGYFKLMENDIASAPGYLNNDSDDDRTLYAGYVTCKAIPGNEFKFMYAYDDINKIPVTDMLGSLTKGALGITGGIPETTSHHIGLNYVGKFGDLELFGEAIYQFGTAENTGLAYDDYDISAFALAANVAYDFKNTFGFSFEPHIGVMYTSGDDDPTDDELNGYNGVENAQRYSKYWGGENTIIGDTNLVMGSLLYGYLPEIYGNGTPVFTGGLQNMKGFGGGRGDNPGMTMLSLGLTTAPKRFLIYRTNVNIFNWNEDFKVSNIVMPAMIPASKIESGYVGTEWDNELTFATSANSFIRGQMSFLFPGDKLKDVTKALGAEADEVASRLAIEFILNF